MHRTPDQSGFQKVVENLFDLCELQLQLFMVDGQKAKKLSTVAIVLLSTSIVVGIPAVVILMLSAVAMLKEFAGWSIWAGTLTVGLCGTVVVGIASWMALSLLSRAAESLQETRREFGDNLRWIRMLITGKRMHVAPDFSNRSTPPDHHDLETLQHQFRS